MSKENCGLRTNAFGAGVAVSVAADTAGTASGLGAGLLMAGGALSRAGALSVVWACTHRALLNKRPDINIFIVFTAWS
jgi:hypothetical protein